MAAAISAIPTTPIPLIGAPFKADISQIAVERTQKASDRAAQETQNTEAEMALVANHGDKVKPKKGRKPSKRFQRAALDANKENIQDA